MQKVLRKLLTRAKKPLRRFSASTTEVPENWHEDFIESLASVVRPRVYVELGLYQCALFNKIIPHAEYLIGVDTEPGAESFMRNSGKTKFVCSTTDEFAEELQKAPIEIDMLFIDADHAKESVLRDFRNFFPFVSPHGLILIHDSYPMNERYTESEYCSNAHEAIVELAKDTSEYELMTIPQHPGLTLCRKRTTQLSWK